MIAMDTTQIYKKCMAEGELEIKGAPTVYCKSLKFPDGHILVYTNDSNDLNLNEKFNPLHLSQLKNLLDPGLI